MSDSETEGSEGILLPGFTAWFVVWVAWVWSTIYLWINYGKFGVAAGVFVWFTYMIYAYHQIPPDQQVVLLSMGREVKFCHSGIVFVLKPFYSLSTKYIFSTKEEYVHTNPTNHYTSPGYSSDGYHGAAKLNNSYSIGFRWSSADIDVHAAVRRAPDPNDKAAIERFIGDVANDVMRQVGGETNWANFVRNGHAVDRLQNALRGTGIIITKVMSLNPDIGQLGDELTYPERARLRGGGDVIIAEAWAEFIRKNGDVGMDIAKMRTMAEMAVNGNMTYLGFPSELYAAIQSRTGGQSPQDALNVSTVELNRMIAKEVRKQRKYRR